MLEKQFYIFVPSDLDFSHSEVNFVPPVIRVQRCVSTKLEVSTAFLFRENWRHGMDRQTDRLADSVQLLMRPPREDHIIIVFQCML